MVNLSHRIKLQKNKIIGTRYTLQFISKHIADIG